VRPYRELYDYLFEVARTCDEGGTGLPGFVDYLGAKQAAGETLKDVDAALDRDEAALPDDGGDDDIAAAPDKQRGVRLMSSHKSKGLEFPVVFLCQADAKGPSRKAVPLFFQGAMPTVTPPLPPELAGRAQGVSTVTLRANYFFEAGSAEEKQKAHAELRRLLYVALTRAERRLYVTGVYKASKGEPTEKDTLLSLLLPAWEGMGGGITAIPWEPVTHAHAHAAPPPLRPGETAPPAPLRRHAGTHPAAGAVPPHERHVPPVRPG
jgi:ATP-dependent helicase/nuclease subunit A